MLLITPGSYDVDKVEKTVHQSSPAYSFGLKYKDTKSDDIPGEHLKFYITNKGFVWYLFQV